jgi:uncharacterized protein
MWAKIARLILRNRFLMLGIVTLITVFWGYMATFLELNHKFATMLPEHDSIQIQYRDMQNRFGEDGAVVVLAINDRDLYTLKKFTAWMELGNKISEIDGVDSVFSVAHMYGLYKNDVEKKFELRHLSPNIPKSQAEVDSIRDLIHSFPFYDGLLYKDETGASLMMIFINSKKFNSKERGTTVHDVVELTENYKDVFNGLHFSGMPYIRDVMFKALKREVNLFILLSAAVTAIIIFLFFRSIRVLIACMCVVLVGVIWSFGTMAAFGYDVSQIMALIPPLMIVIAIPNCIYLITKYHQEYKRTGNKIRALHYVIQKIGIATFLTNATTAVGFGTFIFTKSDKLIEFGVVASINVFAIFFLSLIVIPIVFSFMRPPSVKHTKHLEKKWIDYIISLLVRLASSYRKWVYLVTGLLIGIGLYGMTLIKTTGAITEDMPETSRVKKDLHFIQDHFGGIIPFEIILDFKTEGQIQKEKNLEKIVKIQNNLNNDSVFSKSLSVADAIMFVNQAFNGGNPEKYKLITRSEMAFLKPYLDSLNKHREKGLDVKGFIDSTETQTRITVQVQDLGAKELLQIESRVLRGIDTIMNPQRKELDSTLNVLRAAEGVEKDSLLKVFYENEQRIYYFLIEELASGDSVFMAQLEEEPELIYEHHHDPDFNKHLTTAAYKTIVDAWVTGTGMVYAKGTKYLISNLFSSLIFAIIAISILMAMLFSSVRMVLISLIPNLIPLIFTASIMGFLGVPLKPSTILIFSIALGISVDDAIHYLARYRQDLKAGRSIGESAITAIHESGVSMMYTSIVLFCGFLMFTFSEFGGTKALGLLISITLLVAMLCNLVVLPCLLLSFDKWVTTRAFREPYLEIYDEEVDEELSEIQIAIEEESSGDPEEEEDEEKK